MQFAAIYFETLGNLQAHDGVNDLASFGNWSLDNRGALALNKRAGDGRLRLVDGILVSGCAIWWQGMDDSYGAEA